MRSLSVGAAMIDILRDGSCEQMMMGELPLVQAD
jgi:hypothetical protein